MHIAIAYFHKHRRTINEEVFHMYRTYLSAFLIFLLILFCLPLSGCGTVDEEYQSFYESLVNEDGNFRFRGTKPGDSQDTILQAEGLKGIVDQDITFMDATGLFRCNSPVQFPCFSFDWYREYRTPVTATSPIEQSRYNSAMTSGSYTAFFEQQEAFSEAREQVTAFFKQYVPKGNFTEIPEHTNESVQLSQKWQAESKDGSLLSATFYKISQPSFDMPDFYAIRIEVSYEKLIRSATSEDQTFYQTLVNPEGYFRFCNTEPGQTYEELVALVERKDYGTDVLAPFDIFIRNRTFYAFSCFDFAFSQEYWMKRNGENALSGGCYDAVFYREEDWVAACRQIIGFLKARFSEGDSFEKLEQLPKPDQVVSPQWRVEASDGSSLGITFQNKNAPAHPLAHPASCRIRIDITYQ